MLVHGRRRHLTDGATGNPGGLRSVQQFWPSCHPGSQLVQVVWVWQWKSKMREWISFNRWQDKAEILKDKAKRSNSENMLNTPPSIQFLRYNISMITKGENLFLFRVVFFFNFNNSHCRSRIIFRKSGTKFLPANRALLALWFNLHLDLRLYNLGDGVLKKMWVGGGGYNFRPPVRLPFVRIYNVPGQY